MSNLFKNILKSEESLFLDTLALDFEYLPKELPFRENQQHYIATCIKPLFQNRNGKNLLITGKPGIGKTAATKHVLRELENETSDIITLYINCWKTDTSYKIALEICNQINYKYIQNKKTSELFKDISKILNKKSTVICLDEIDKVKDFSALYTILEDIYKKTVLVITNDETWLSTLDPRIKSRLALEILNFKPYNLKETEGILKQRIQYAFIPNVWQLEALNKIVEKTYSVEDIRAGLSLLKEAGEIAESKASRKILLEHVEKVINKTEENKLQLAEKVDEDEEKIIKIIKQNSGKKIIDLYNIYTKEGGVKVYRTFHRKMKYLESKKKITIKATEHGDSSIVYYGESKNLTEF